MTTNLKTKIKSMSAIVSLMMLLVLMSCSGNSEKAEETQVAEIATESESTEELDPMKDKGIGPVTSVEIGPIDQTLADKGREIFEAKCSACHKFESKYVGPGLKGVTQRRTPEWIMNMILNPTEMTQKNATAQALLEEHLTQMTFQDLTQDEARAVLEYFRLTDSN